MCATLTDSFLYSLKTEDEPQTVEDLKRKGNIDLESKPDLYQLLKSNDKVSYDERDGTFVYKV